MSVFLKCSLRNASAEITREGMFLVENTNAESESLEIRHENLNFNEIIYLFSLLEFVEHWVPMNVQFPLVCILPYQ